jgi:hypothetical protein
MESSNAGVSATKKNGVIEGNIRSVRRSRVKYFDLADRSLNRLVRFANAMHEGFWLGCLNADELNAVTAEHFDQSQYYASTEHNLSGFFGWEKSVLDRFFRRGSRILVAGAGGGREVLALRKAGFDAEGFECSLPLVRASEQIFDRLGESRYVSLCEPDSVPQGPRIYEGLVVGWTIYTHIPTKARRVGVAQQETMEDFFRLLGDSRTPAWLLLGFECRGRRLPGRRTIPTQSSSAGRRSADRTAGDRTGAPL